MPRHVLQILVCAVSLKGSHRKNELATQSTQQQAISMHFAACSALRRNFIDCGLLLLQARILLLYNGLHSHAHEYSERGCMCRRNMQQ